MNRAGRALCCAATAALLLAACNPAPERGARGPTAAPSPTPPGVPPLKITGRGTKQQPVRVFEQSGNRKVYELVAQSYVSHSSQSAARATFAHAEVTFYDKDGTTLNARAPVANSDERNKSIVLTGGVHAKTSTGLTLTCDRLSYDGRSGMVHGEGNVRITGMQGGSQQILTGNSFTSNVKLTQMVMK